MESSENERHSGQLSSVQLRFTQHLAKARAGQGRGIQRRLRHSPAFKELTGWSESWKVKNFLKYHMWLKLGYQYVRVAKRTQRRRCTPSARTQRMHRL